MSKVRSMRRADMEGQNSFQTTQALKNLLNEYSMRSTSRYMLPESIYGKVRLEPFVQMEYGYARVEFKIGIDTMYVLKKDGEWKHAVFFYLLRLL